MEVLIGLLVLVFIALPLIGVWLGIGLFAAEKKGRATAVTKAPDTLEQLFRDAGETVTYDTRPYNALQKTPVMLEAIQRGYDLANDDGGLLLFVRRVGQSSSSATRTT